jgi:thiamine-phosphate pyrophosphorylase
MSASPIRSVDPQRLRATLSEARLMLIFSPELCAGRDPVETLESVLEWVDIVQIRPKAAGDMKSPASSSARLVHDWCVRVLDLLAAHREWPRLVIVNDRVDVAAALGNRGCAGVHLGQDDCPAAVARHELGPEPLIGLSTHDMAQVAGAAVEAIDYLGFGPIHATRTKGYADGVGAEACWIASATSAEPVFPIGGIDATNIGELSRIGRAAVGSAILSAEDPARSARELRALLAS